MAAPLAIFAAGTALSIFGQYQANMAQAKAERENASWLDQQAQYAQIANQREQGIFLRESNQFMGAQYAAISSSGVDLAGSALDVIDESFRLIQSELDAIQLSGEMQVREALLKAGAARNKAASLEDPMTNLLQAGGTGLSGIARFM